jgi:hypothetical protein
MHMLLQSLPAYDQIASFDAILRDLARRFLRNAPDILDVTEDSVKAKSTVAGIAAMVRGLAQSNTILERHVVEWLTSTSGEYAGLGLDVRRAVVATLATCHGKSSPMRRSCCH